MGSWEQALDRWLTTPPDEEEPVMFDSLDNAIYDGEKYYSINGIILSDDGLEESKEYIVDEETITCSYCEEEVPDEYYYRINGECFCEHCIKETEQTADRELDYE